jgi:hypothetical protein
MRHQQDWVDQRLPGLTLIICLTIMCYPWVQQTTDWCVLSLVFQTLHIAVVCSGQSTSRQVVILIKSILFYRRNPLHFHFVSDKIAITILTTLFQSWNIPLGGYILLHPYSATFEWAVCMFPWV